MSELKDIEQYAHTLEEKMESWFKKHFDIFEPGTEAHTVAQLAHTELKTIITTPPAPSPVPAIAAPTGA